MSARPLLRRFVDAVAGPATLDALAYLLGGVVVPLVLFVAVVTGTSVALSLTVTVVGLPLLLGAALVVQGSAAVERARLAPVLGAATPAPPRRQPASPGIAARLAATWTDPTTWRELTHLVLVFPLLYVLDLAALCWWIAVVAMVSNPLWYWAIPQDFPDGSTAHGLAYGYFPHGPHGEGAIGLFVGDLRTAVLVALAFLPVLAASGLLVRAAARLHARVAAALLGPLADPVAAARQVLADDSPLPSLAPFTPRDDVAAGQAPTAQAATTG